MTKIEKLQVKASELRSDINGLLFQEDALTDDQNAALTEKRAALEDVEKRWRIAVETHPDPTERERETTGDTLSTEQTEFATLEDGVKLAGFLLGAPSGASLEYRQETGLGDAIPWVGLLDAPERVQLRADAYSEAPATGTAVNVQAIIDRVTAGLHARRLGIMFPVVARGTAAWQHVSGGVTPTSAAKGAAVDASSWTLTPKTADPKRVQVRVAWRREDAAMVAMFEDALRREARAALEEALDKMALDSFGTGTDIINGLRPSLTVGASLGDIAVGALLKGMASVIDGKYASDLKMVRIALGPETYRALVSVLTSIGLPQLAADLSSLIADVGASVFTSAHIPDAVSKEQDSLTWAGNADHIAAVAPVWEDGLTAVLDQYSGARKGEVYSDLLTLTNFVLIDAAAYSRRPFDLP